MEKIKSGSKFPIWEELGLLAVKYINAQGLNYTGEELASIDPKETLKILEEFEDRNSLVKGLDKIHATQCSVLDLSLQDIRRSNPNAACWDGNANPLLIYLDNKCEIMKRLLKTNPKFAKKEAPSK